MAALANEPQPEGRGDSTPEYVGPISGIQFRPRGKQARAAYLGWLAPLALCAAIVAMLWSFTADDAFIVYRYAHNFVAGHGVVFNLGERISALTSPAHFLVVAAITALGLDIELVYKLLAVSLVLASTAWFCARVVAPEGRSTLLALTLCSPSLLLWTVGGLETPLLIAAVNVAVALCWSERPLSAAERAAFFLAASLAFLVRHDSVLFLGPCALGVALRHRREPITFVLAALCALLPLGWFAFSHRYFGDVLPTSFYVKGSVKPSPKGILYTISFFVVSGVCLPLLPLWRVRRELPRAALAVLRERPFLAAGLGLHVAYSLMNGAVHMMFSYRMYVPLLAVYAALALALRARFSDAVAFSWRDASAALGFNAALAAVVVLNTVNPTILHFAELFGVRSHAEYGDESVRSYTGGFVETMRLNARDVAADWRTHPEAQQRPPRVATYAAGVLPWVLRDAYVFESLISFRRGCRPDPYPASDYVQIIWPRHGPPETQLEHVPGAQRISHHVVDFDGSKQNFDVFYNPRPQPNPLPNRIDLACLSNGPSSPSPLHH